MPYIHQMAPIRKNQPARPANDTRNARRAPMLVIMMKYTLPISTNTPMMTVRMPRSSGIQAPGPLLTPDSVASTPIR